MLTTTFCAVLTAAGLAIAVRTAYRRRFLRATRIAALALLPVGLAMAGLVTLGRRIGTAIGDWALDLVFKPSVWAGFVVLACAAGLYGVTRLFSRGGRGDREQAAASAPAVAPAAASGQGGGNAPGLPGGRGAGARSVTGGGRAKGRGRGGDDSGLSDFADVEEILKRRGI